MVQPHNGILCSHEESRSWYNRGLVWNSPQDSLKFQEKGFKWYKEYASIHVKMVREPHGNILSCVRIKYLW